MWRLLLIVLLLTGCASSPATTVSHLPPCQSGRPFELNEARNAYLRCPFGKVSLASLDRYTLPMAAFGAITLCERERSAFEGMLVECTLGDVGEVRRIMNETNRRLFPSIEAAIEAERSGRHRE